jgi:antitoxin FitA
LRFSRYFALRKKGIEIGVVDILLAFCMHYLQNAFMVKSITIRNIPDQSRDELAARAARQGQSLQEFLRSELIALAERPDNRSLMASVRARKHQTRSTLSAERILELRDLDRK